MLTQFQSVGCDLSMRGLVSSHSGNLSIRLGDNLVITKRGSMLGCLAEHDLIETGIKRNNRATPLASTELAVHRAIYRETPALAIVHAHSPHALALSLTESEVIPCDAEGCELFLRVPILGQKMKPRPGELAEAVAHALKEHRIVLVSGHGSFATGQLLEEACHYTAALEESCRIICLLRALGTSPARRT